MCWVVAGGFAAWAAARLTAADRVRRTEIPVVPLLSVTPQVAAAAPWAALGLRLTEAARAGRDSRARRRGAWPGGAAARDTEAPADGIRAGAAGAHR